MGSANRLLVASVRAVVHGWEALQVELRGQYSLNRFEELVEFSANTTSLSSLKVLVLTPLSCLATVILIDALPLKPPVGGIWGQSYTYWVRTFASVAVITLTVILQYSYSSTALYRSPVKLFVATSAIAAGTCVLFRVMHLLIGFPSSFLYQTASLPWQVLVFSSTWIMWKEIIRTNVEALIRTNVEARRDLLQYIWLFASQCAMIVVYPVMIFAFGTLSGSNQTIFSVCLPMVKLLLKNWSSYGVFRLEDLTPVYVVLSVDVFHALFLSCAMQSASSRGTLFAVMSVDIFQSVVAVVEIRGVLAQLHQFQLAFPVNRLVGPSKSDMRGPQSPLSHATWILTMYPSLRMDPQIGRARHERGLPHQLPWRDMHLSVANESRIAPVAWPSLSNVHRRSVGSGPARNAHAQYVRLTLKLLHMVEYYVLIEYTEVIVAVIYSTYLATMRHLPNRVYYLSMKDRTDAELVSTVIHVLEYAGLELLSLLILCLVLNRLLICSTLHLLAFTLSKHALLAQSLIVLWVFFAVQLSIDHLGNDYSFRFGWLLHHGSDAVNGTLTR